MQKQIIRRNRVDDSHLPDFLHPRLKQIYASRGVVNASELDDKLTGLLSPDTLLGATQAAELLLTAMTQHKRITVIGDFDADGATSTALVHSALNMLGYRNHDFLVPNRFKFGYGLTTQIVELAHSQGSELLLTVDNGISCHQGVERAKSLGLQVVVTDHHLPGESLPNADAIVNPNQPDCTFASKNMAGVGVAFYLMLALRKSCREQAWFSQHNITEPNFAELLDLVALGTVADVVQLDAHNRLLVSQGLKRIRAGKTRAGIQALIEIAKKQQYRLIASDFGFGLGPRINAAGRLDDMAYGINCLLCNDLMQARQMALTLDELNLARREIEQGMQQQAQSILQQLAFDQDNLPAAFALYHDTWHQGVIGIVAGRLKEQYHRPCIVFAENDENTELVKGSARSIQGIHIRDVLADIDAQHPELILGFGGHAMAAGLTLAKADIAKFAQIFEQSCESLLTDEIKQQQVLTDGELTVAELTLDFAELLRASGPFGQGFAEPVFDDEFVVLQQKIVGEKHLKLVLGKDQQLFDAIAFNIDTKQWPNAQCQQVHIAYKLDVNEFRNQRNVQLLIEEIHAL